MLLVGGPSRASDPGAHAGPAEAPSAAVSAPAESPSALPVWPLERPELGDPVEPSAPAPGTATNAPTNPSERLAADEQLLKRLFDPMSFAEGDEERQRYVVMLEEARRQRRAGDYGIAIRNLIALVRSSAPEEVRGPAMFELALVAIDEGLNSRAQQILSQYIQVFPRQPGVIEAYLRQGILLRQMGAASLAISKFYGVMSSALSLKLDQLEYYQRLVLQAQIEIADTYYEQGRWDDAADFLGRLLKLGSPHLDRGAVSGKLIKALAAAGRTEPTITQAISFLETYPKAPEVPEVRFLLAQALKTQGRREEALQQVLLLLEAQQGIAKDQPQSWVYWQKRVGNEIVNDLYAGGDYFGALQICQRLVTLDPTAAWQFPVLYQMGLVYERLEQPSKAAEVYAGILERGTEATGDQASPNLQTVVDMARWRRGNLAWLQQAVAKVRTIQNASTAPPEAPEDDHAGGNH